MYIAGIADVSHDKSVCIMRNNKILSAIEEERLTRIKHGIKLDANKYTILGYGKHVHSILDKLTVAKREKTYFDCMEYCLKKTNLTINDIDMFIVSSLFSDLPLQHKAIFLHHHVAHCASTFYPSPFKESAILAIDGYGVHNEGKSDTVMFAMGNNNEIKILDTITGYCEFTTEEQKQVSNRSHMVFKNSLGVFYQNLTVLIGLGVYGEGKSMGLSAFGEDNKKFNMIRNFIELLPNGKLTIDNRSIFTLCRNWINDAKRNSDPKKVFKFYADLAFKHQQIIEEMISHMCNYLYKQTKCKSICLAGGVALNSVANGKILCNTPFKNIFVQPAAGDNGISIGCAMYGAHALKGYPRFYTKRTFSPYLGMKYSNKQINTAINKYLSQIDEKKKINNPYKLAAKLVSQGKIVAWFNNESEIGPRALGNRTILADPRPSDMKDYLNHYVKHRESFRPYAPAVLENQAKKYFNIDKNNYAALYMLFVVDIKESAKKLIPAVTHIDGTARIQTVKKELNKDFYEIISNFEKITGLPIILNTSFNDVGEPIVETPEDAIKCFLKTNIDYLFINKRLFIKKSTA